MELDLLKQRWQEFEAKSFPLGHRSKVIAGRNLTSFSCEIGGLILSFLNTGGWLGGRQTMVVSAYAAEAEKTLDELEGEAKNYFRELFDILGLVAAATDTARN